MISWPCQWTSYNLWLQQVQCGLELRSLLSSATPVHLPGPHLHLLSSCPTFSGELGKETGKHQTNPGITGLFYSALQFPVQPALILRITQWLEGKDGPEWMETSSQSQSLCRKGQRINPKSTQNVQGQSRRNPSFNEGRTTVWNVYLVQGGGNCRLQQMALLKLTPWNAGFQSEHLQFFIHNLQVVLQNRIKIFVKRLKYFVQ